MALRNGLAEASAIAQKIISVGPDIVNWNLDVNRVIPELDCVPDPDSIYGYRAFWDGRTVRFVFSTFHSYPYVREAVVRAGLQIEKDCPDTRRGPWSRHAILIRIDKEIK